MLPLGENYWEKLELIASEIQGSDDLQRYLEEEEEEHYQLLKEAYEPAIAEVYDDVATNDPLQLVSLEKTLLHEAFEGLFLPRVLGYSVLRGDITDQYKYSYPQEHFKEVLLAICNSANFEILRKRIGQSIQVGFAMSSDIWVTNLMESITNKRIRNFLNTQRVERARQIEERTSMYQRYARQFQNENFLSSDFPMSRAELTLLFPGLKRFLAHRIRTNANNESILPYVKELVMNEDFHGTEEHFEIMGLYANCFDPTADDRKNLAKTFNHLRKQQPLFTDRWFSFLLHARSLALDMDHTAQARVSSLLDKKIHDKLSDFYALMDIINSRGYMSQEAQDAVKAFYFKNEGLSNENELLRQTIFSYFARVINNIEPTDYHELFEQAKYYSAYMQIFNNQHFNQSLESISMGFVHRAMQHFTDKRGKDYQDIKKFVSNSFTDFGFLTEKEVVELFKTRRKKKEEA
jgi:hypothetical protein